MSAQLYDVTIERMRPVTQADVDAMLARLRLTRPPADTPPVSIDLDALLDGIFEAFRAHSSPTYDRGDAHGARGQSGIIVWRHSHEFIRQAVRDATGASIRPPMNPPP
jgi:hypothetical protein